MKDIQVSRMNRREFLVFGWVSSLAVLFGQAGVAFIQFFKPRIASGAFGTRILAGRVEEFLPGTVSHIQSGRFFISRTEDGGYLALWHRCTHLGCTVPWREDEQRFHCPCHSSIFDLVGEVISGPAPRPMDIFPITLVNGELLVDTGKPIERQQAAQSDLIYP